LKVVGGQFGIPCAIRVAIPLSNFMKYPIAAVLLSTTVFVAGCNSLDNPLAGLFHTGNDARVFNPQTGQYEWPPEQRKPQPRGPATAGGTTPAPERQSEGRYYDPQKNQWVEARDEKPTAGKLKKPASPPVVLMTTPVPVGTPPPVRPPRARGVYNPSTGQIEWTDFNPAPSATPVPEKKKWYWPF